MTNQEEIRKILIRERLELIKDMKKVKDFYEDKRDMYALMNVKYFKVDKHDFYKGFCDNLKLKHDEKQLNEYYNNLLKTCELAGETKENYVFSYDGTVRGFEKLIQKEKE